MEVPKSCCSETSLTDHLGVCVAKNAHEQGCEDKLASQLQTIGTILYVTLLVIVLLEVEYFNQKYRKPFSTFFFLIV